MPCANQLLYHPPWPFLVSGSRCHQLGTIQTMMATCDLAALVGPLNGKIIAMGCLHPPKIWCFPVKIFPKKKPENHRRCAKNQWLQMVAECSEKPHLSGCPLLEKKTPCSMVKPCLAPTHRGFLQALKNSGNDSYPIWRDSAKTELGTKNAECRERILFSRVSGDDRG